MKKRILSAFLAFCFLLVLFPAPVTAAEERPVAPFRQIASGVDGDGRLCYALIDVNGSLWMWGNNADGQLGDGTTAYRSTPVKVMDNVASVSLSGYHTAAIDADGSLWMWGYNYYGQLGDGRKLGDGSARSRSSPVKIMDGIASVHLHTGRSVAIGADGSLWSWGRNDRGQVGDGTRKMREGEIADRSVPVKIMDSVSSVSLGDCHSAAIDADGSLWMWGDNYYGQLGIGLGANPFVPVKIMDSVSSVSLGDCHSAAILKDGSL